MLEKKIKNFNILFLGGGKRVSIAKKFIDSGKKLNLKVNLFSYELNRKVPFKIVGKVILGKKWSDKNILKDLNKIIRTKKISLLISCVDQATFLLPKINRLLIQRISITSNIEALNTVYDKEKMFYFCKKNKIDTINIKKSIPLIIKPKTGSASKKFYIIKNKKDLIKIEKKINLNKFIFQEYILGKEYSVDCYVSENKKMIFCVPRERIKVFQGEVMLTKVIKNKRIIRVSENIIKKLNLSGPLNLQFIKKGNKFLLMDINPRLGGGVLASIEAGFDIAKIMLQDIKNLKIRNKSNYRELIMDRFMTEVFYETNN